MARIRSLKPDYFLDDKLAEQKPINRILFAGLWCLADREGRLEDNPKKIKVQVLPYDNHDVDKALDDLSTGGFIIRYQSDGKRYIEVVNFLKHQKPHHTEKPSIIPAPLNNGEITVKEPLRNGNRRVGAVDCSLVIDHGSLDKNVGGQAHQEPAQIFKNSLKEQAKEVLTFLNQKTGKAYQPVSANLDMIIARLREGATPAQLRKIVAKKHAEWSIDEKMNQYLRPKTLFNKTNCANYIGELVLPSEVQNVTVS